MSISHRLQRRFGFDSILLLLTIFLVGISTQLYASGRTPTNNQQSVYSNNALPINDIERFTHAIAQIKRYYVKDVSDQTLFENAIAGMLAGLDPHSNFLNEKALRALYASTQGEFSGLGLEVSVEDNSLVVVSPTDDSPAARAGIQSGDIIAKIDNTATQGLTLNEAVKLMRGKKDTPVTLTIYREGEEKPLKITVLRDTIKTHAVKGLVLDHQYGYIRVSQFQSPSAKQVRDLIHRIEKNNHAPIKGWILDMRNNPGGLLDVSVAMSDLFLDKNKLGKNDLIVYTKGRALGADEKVHATAGDILNGAPLVVLINGGSASAAEIVAGALQDHGRALIVGQRSFGKGSVQTVLPLDATSGIKLTTALYYTPSGRAIQAKGIKPDVEIKNLSVKPNTKAANLTIKESDLVGHLNSRDSGSKKGFNKQGSLGQYQLDSNELILQDYMLYETLLILKSLSVMENPT